MKKTITLLALLAGFLSHAQDKDRFNIGLHYHPQTGDSELYGFTGGGDLRVRAISLGKVNLGAGLTATFRESKQREFSNSPIINPHIYSEFEVFPIKLKPYAGVGYAFYNLKFERRDYYPSVEDQAFATSDKAKYSGYSVCVGLRFDFARILFADAGITHYTFSSDSFSGTYGGGNYNFIHLGLGFRF